MPLTDKELEALLELEKLASMHRTISSKSWAFATKEKPELHEILGHPNPRALAQLYKKHLNTMSGLCSECGNGLTFKAGLCEIHYDEHLEKMAELRSRVKIRIDDSYEVRVANPNQIVILNHVTGKQFRFKTESGQSLEEKIDKICRELMRFNKMRQPRYKLMFESPLQTMNFIKKLKKRIRDLEK